jgi:hypothetical protein
MYILQHSAILKHYPSICVEKLTKTLALKTKQKTNHCGSHNTTMFNQNLKKQDENHKSQLTQAADTVRHLRHS